MKNKKIEGINIQYDDFFENKIDKILDIIKMNKLLFFDYKGKTICFTSEEKQNHNSTIYISNFNSFFDDVLLKFIKVNDNLFSQISLVGLYLQLLSIGKNHFIDFKFNLSEDDIYFLIAFRYFDYKNDFNSLSIFLKERKNKELIFNWLSKTQRYDLYNYLLKFLVDYFNNYDSLFLNNLKDFMIKVDENTTNENNIDKIFKYSESKLPKISQNEFERVLFNFLIYINEAEKWDYYCKLKKENRIVFSNTNEEDCSCCFKDKDGILKIKISSDETILDLLTFVHEFVHLIALESESVNDLLDEFPSIYFENIAANYLIDIGYLPKDLIMQMLDFRVKDNFEILTLLSSNGILDDVYRFKIKGVVTKEELVKEEKMKYDNFKRKNKDLLNRLDNAKLKDELKETLYLVEKYYSNCEYIVDKKIDNNILLIISDLKLIIQSIQYLVGSYLSKSLLDKDNKYEDLEKMKHITKNLKDFNIESVSDYLNIEFMKGKENRLYKKKN